MTNILQADGGNDTLVLKFSVKSSCYVTQNVGFNLRYYDCCDDTQYSTTPRQQVTALFPTLTVTKTPVSTTTDCGTAVTWTVVVNNNGTGNAQVVRVEDTLGDWLTYVPGSFTTPDKPGTSIANLGGQVWAWEFNNLAAGATATFTLGSTLSPDWFAQPGRLYRCLAAEQCPRHLGLRHSRRRHRRQPGYHRL